MKYTLIRNGTLIDGNGGPPMANVAVPLEDNHIRTVDDQHSVALPEADVSELVRSEIDAEGGFITIDAGVTSVPDAGGADLGLKQATTRSSPIFTRGIRKINESLVLTSSSS